MHPCTFDAPQIRVCLIKERFQAVRSFLARCFGQESRGAKLFLCLKSTARPRSSHFRYRLFSFNSTVVEER